MKKIYWIHWIDKYLGPKLGRPSTHASLKGDKSLCGIDYSKRLMNGGYQTTEELMPDCKKCIKIIEND